MQETYVKIALEKAGEAFKEGEVPVAAIIIDYKKDKIIAVTINQVELLKDVTAHAEMLALREACQLVGNKFLGNCDMYVTLEPCPMCAQAISFARIRRLYFGAYDIKSGGVEHGAQIYNSSSCHHRPEVYGGIAEEESAKLLKDFFKTKR